MYAHINEDNILQGWFDTEIHQEIPTPNIEVTVEQWQIAVANSHNKINADGSSEVIVIDNRTELERCHDDRRNAYPSIGEQLDMIFHAGLGGDEFQAAIQAVKDAHPKPE
jgi:hypothetical protein